MKQPKLTIAQKRAAEVGRLARIATDNPTNEDMRTAHRLMNSYYRLCGLAETNLWRQNDPMFCNSNYARMQEEKELAWHHRLSKEFNDRYGLSLYYLGYRPSIVKLDPHGGAEVVINTYFYN